MFEAPTLLGLIPMILFIILVFRKWNPVAAIGASLIVGAILSGQSITEISTSIQDGLGSFLAYVGLIIMAGAGLGKILEETGVAKRIVSFIMDKVGISTPKRAIIGTMIASTVLVALLGTLAGANAVIAPVVIPIVASVGLSSSVVAILFQGAGATGLFLGPFTPPMVTLMELTGLSYLEILISASIPVSIVLWIVTYFYAKKILPKSLKEHPYSEEDIVSVSEDDKDSKNRNIVNQSTWAFLITLIGLLVYGIIIEGGSTFAIFVILSTAIVTGLVGRLHPSKLAETFVKGAQPMVWLFFQFVLFTPFIQYIETMGGFEALADLLMPFIESSSSSVMVILTTIIGIAGIPGAAVAQSVIMHEMFGGIATDLAIPMSIWVIVLLVGSQLTSFLYPTGDTLGAMGIARSNDIKNMIVFGFVASVTVILFVTVRSFFI
ncbi:SLC13 family permease [Oceanobacillus halotolerans]|uniref:SLC13 family permease n=1 Tax=Oceanobacillus halotolerans TaxID=2663380 RepID=UPI0013DA3FE4|nr:SLC13 family permease [Oceanobacillus halotolerans]